MNYRISPIEIKRRKKAYATLSTSIMVGLFLASVVFTFPINIGGYLLTATILLLMGLFSFKFLNKLSQTKIKLSNQLLERVDKKHSYKYSLNKIKRLKIKWTTNKTIREIYIHLNNGKSIAISAVNQFEDFKNNLLSKVNKNTKIKETHEPLDYDHPLFYSILGLPISAAAILILKFAPSLSYKYIKIGEIIFSVYLLILGTYFIIEKPILKSLDKKIAISDYVMGISMIGLGFVILFIL